MNNVSRHPSAPRKTAVTPGRVPPVGFCKKCNFLGPIATGRTESGNVAVCPDCGFTGEVIPPDTQLVRAHFGDGWAKAVAQAQQTAYDLAVSMEKKARIAEAQRIADRRAQTRQTLQVAAVIVCAVAAVVAFFIIQARSSTAEETFAALQEESARAQAVLAESRRQTAAPAPIEAPEPPKRLTISTSGTAAAKPGGEPVMRVTAGEVYTLGEERDGWIRLSDAPVEAWVEAKAVAR